MRKPARLRDQIDKGSDVAERVGSLDEQVKTRLSLPQSPLEWAFYSILVPAVTTALAKAASMTWWLAWAGPFGWFLIGLIGLVLLGGAVLGFSWLAARGFGLWRRPATAEAAGTALDAVASSQRDRPAPPVSPHHEATALAARLDALETAPPAGLGALASRLTDVEASGRELNRLWEVTAALGSGQVEHERAFADHLAVHKEFVRWTNVRLDRLEGFAVRAERLKRLKEHKKKIEDIIDFVKKDHLTRASQGIDNLRMIATHIETLFEVKGIRNQLRTILELTDNDVRAGRMDPVGKSWATFQRQREILAEAIAKLEKESADADYETNDALLTHR